MILFAFLGYFNLTETNNDAVDSPKTRAFIYDAAGDTTQDTRGTTAWTYGISGAGRIAQLGIGSTVTANSRYDFKNRPSIRQTLNTSPAGTSHDTFSGRFLRNAGTILRRSPSRTRDFGEAEYDIPT